MVTAPRGARLDALGDSGRLCTATSRDRTKRARCRPMPYAVGAVRLSRGSSPNDPQRQSRLCAVGHVGTLARVAHRNVRTFAPQPPVQPPPPAAPRPRASVPLHGGIQDGRRAAPMHTRARDACRGAARVREGADCTHPAPRCALAWPNHPSGLVLAQAQQAAPRTHARHTHGGVHVYTREGIVHAR